ncbi:MAG: cytochrome P450 [Cytophagales bacterium]|nr:cytochrome P450 [Cytophagales bacterium]
MSKIIPEIPSGSIFGHLKAYVGDPLTFLQKYRDQYGDIFTFRVVNRRLIFINHPDFIERVLQENHRNYIKSEAYRKLALLLGDGLFTSNGDYWLSQRRTIQPAFHRDQIKTYAQVMHDLSMSMVNAWKKRSEIELASEMTNVTLKIISKTMLDVELGKEGQTVEQYLPYALKYMVNRITSPLATPLWIPTKNNQKFKAAIKILDELIHEIIRFKKENLNIDLISQLILLINEKTGKGMNDRQLRDEVMTLFLAGHETTAMAMTWILNYILRDEEIRKKLLREINRIRNSWSAIKNYFIQNVINEALRLFAPVWILSREALGKDRLGAFDIQKGDRIIFSPYMVHRHPAYWDFPEEFIPERFDKDLPHRFAYFPFGGGPRVCIGQHFALMEMTILLVNILKNFPEMKLTTQKSIGYDYSITLRPDRKIFVQPRAVQ